MNMLSQFQNKRFIVTEDMRLVLKGTKATKNTYFKQLVMRNKQMAARLVHSMARKCFPNKNTPEINKTNMDTQRLKNIPPLFIYHTYK